MLFNALSPDQLLFAVFDTAVIYPVPNKWGKKGDTYFELKTVHKSMLNDALKSAYFKAISRTSA